MRTRVDIEGGRSRGVPRGICRGSGAAGGARGWIGTGTATERGYSGNGARRRLGGN